MWFGQRIHQLRVEKRLSQRELADKVGIDFTYLSKIENRKVAPPSEVITRLARELGANDEELLALAAKVSQEELRETVARDSRLGVLFRKIQSGNLTDGQIRKILDIVDMEKGNIAESDD